MTNDEPKKRIEEAIVECVRRCARSDSPAVCISEYLIHLRSDRSWSMTDVVAVGQEALSLLDTMMEKAK